MRVAVQYKYFYATGAAPVPVVVEEDSRYWTRLRRNARLDVEGDETWIRPGTAKIAASASAQIEGGAAFVESGELTSVGSTVSAIRGWSVEFEAGVLSARSKAFGSLVGSEVSLGHGQLMFTAQSIYGLVGDRVHGQTSRPAVLIGIDQVVEEDEELLFLLEVA